MKQCPRCSSELSSNDKVCPRCGLKVSQMQEYEKQFGSGTIEETPVQTKSRAEKKAKKKAEKKAKKLQKKQEKKERKIRESKSDTDFSKMAINSEDNEALKDVPKDDSYKARRERQKYKETTPQFELDENGEFNIDTSDVEIVGEKTGKIIDEQYEKTYSVKKARGDYHPPKIKWWELYKLADRSFARRKIKKEVNKAAIKKPDFIKKSKLLLLAIFLGWTGAHNFYAKNKKKGIVSLVTLIIWVGVYILGNYVPFFASIRLSISGFAGFINIFMWITDIISIITNKYKYRIQKEAFIFGMNVETRAKLGEKYIDLELYQKPWWVRFKVWCQKKKREWQESKKERQQRKIDREKRKLAEAEKREKMSEEIDNFVAEEKSKEAKTEQSNVEAGEEQEQGKKESEGSSLNLSKIVDKKTLMEINSFDGGLTEVKSSNNENKESNGEEETKKQTDNKSRVKKSFKSKNKKK